MMVAWRFPDATVAGVEAQEVSAGMAHRSLRINGLADRCGVELADMRAWPVAPVEPFDLITGTPHYFDTSNHTMSEATQRGPCRFVLRGGAEVYAAAGSRFVFCDAWPNIEADLAAATEQGWWPERVVQVIPRAGKEPLIGLVSTVRSQVDCTRAQLTVRDREGRFTPEMTDVRRRMGFPVRG